MPFGAPLGVDNVDSCPTNFSFRELSNVRQVASVLRAEVPRERESAVFLNCRIRSKRPVARSRASEYANHY